jgi:energy-converting hydrogenase Eha subunit F
MRAFALAVLLAPALALGAVAQDKPAAPAPTPQTEQQATPPATPPAAATEQASKSLVLTEAQAKEWVGKPVYSNEGKKIGEVVAFARGADDVVAEMHADIGGFLGLGETRVKLTADQFELKGDRVIIDMTSAQAKDLPKVE